MGLRDRKPSALIRCLGYRRERVARSVQR
jgi:hypothetical protein